MRGIFSSINNFQIYLRSLKSAEVIAAIIMLSESPAG